MNENFLRTLRVDLEGKTGYPFNIAAVRDYAQLQFDAPVTFFVGENGSGKSTMVEAIAVAAGFNAEGGTKNYSYTTMNTTSSLADHITLVRGARREKAGFFLRAESFYTTANYAETGTYAGSDLEPTPIYFDGKRAHEQSHGEAFMAIAHEFLPNGLYIFDEPESALSPKRLLELMYKIRQLTDQGSQFIIATHSPILLAYPGVIYEFSDTGIDRAVYDELEHVQLTKDFLANPDAYLRHVVGE